MGKCCTFLRSSTFEGRNLAWDFHSFQKRRSTSVQENPCGNSTSSLLFPIGLCCINIAQQSRIYVAAQSKHRLRKFIPLHTSAAPKRGFANICRFALALAFAFAFIATACYHHAIVLSPSVSLSHSTLRPVREEYTRALRWFTHISCSICESRQCNVYINGMHFSLFLSVR